MRNVLLLVGLCGCGAGGGVEAPTPEGAVRLRFRWPEALELQVAAALERARSASGEEDVQRAEASWAMSAEQVGGGWRVSTREVGVPEGDVPPVVAALAFGAHPDFLVDREGRVEAVVGGDVLRLAAAPVMAMMPPEPQARFQERLTDEALLGAIRDDWEALVGRHAGRTLAPRPSEPVRGTLPLPLAPDVQVDTLTTETWERVPCGEADCVRIVWTEALAPDATAALTDAMRADIAASMGAQGFGAPEVRDLGLEYRWELVTEPETLVPHRLTTTRTMSVGLALEGADVVVEQVDTHDRAYAPR